MPSSLATLHSPMRSLGRANEALARMNARVKNIQGKAQETTDKIVRSAEVFAGGAAAGFIQGKYGPVEVVGVPVELAVGVGLNLASHLKVAGTSSEHLGSIGDGFLAAYSATLFRGIARASSAPATPAPLPAP